MPIPIIIGAVVLIIFHMIIMANVFALFKKLATLSDEYREVFSAGTIFRLGDRTVVKRVFDTCDEIGNTQSRKLKAILKLDFAILFIGGISLGLYGISQAIGESS